MTYNPIKTLEKLIRDVSHDTYFLTRDDIDAIEWRLREVKDYIRELYAKKGKEFK